MHLSFRLDRGPPVRPYPPPPPGVMTGSAPRIGGHAQLTAGLLDATSVVWSVENRAALMAHSKFGEISLDFRKTGAGADQIRTGGQSQDCEGDWFGSAGLGARPRRRGDRVIAIICCACSGLLMARSGGRRMSALRRLLGVEQTQRVHCPDLVTPNPTFCRRSSAAHQGGCIIRSVKGKRSMGKLDG